MSAARLRVAYDGPALRTAQMDVRDLAPALLSLGDAFQEANKVLYGKDRAVRVLVKAEFQPGSFGISLEVVQGWLAGLVAIFSGDASSGAANLIEILGFGKTISSNSVLWAIKKLKGKQPTSVKRLDAGNGVSIECDGENFTLKKPVFDVLKDERVRTALYQTMSPLNKNGIDLFEVIESNGGVETKIPIVGKEDLPALAPPAPAASQDEQEVASSNRPMALTVIAPSFKEGNKWRFSDGNNAVTAEMLDPDFLQRLQAREETFAKDDVLICDVAIRQYAGPSGLRSEYSITKVTDHKRLPRQEMLFAPPGDDGKKE